METLLQDTRYAVRTLIRQPGFAATAILTLALGIGGATAIFSVVNAIVLRPLPFADPDRVVQLTTVWTKTGVISPNLSAPDFRDLREQNRSFDALAYYAGGRAAVSTGGAADYANVYRVTDDFFRVLGVTAAYGRLLVPQEYVAGGDPAVVISDAYWRRQFGADPRAVGSPLKAGGRTFTIVGVLPPGLRYPARADVYSASWLVPETASRAGHNYLVIGRLRPDVTLAQAKADTEVIARRLEQQYPNTNATKSMSPVPLLEFVLGRTTRTLYVLLGAVLVVLLIACANVANLLLSRANVRGREMVIRSAVGAARGRLIRQLLTESVLLAGIAALVGIALARAGVAAVVRLAPADLPRIDELAVDWTMLGSALLIAVVSIIVFGIAPATHTSRVQLGDELRQSGKGTAAAGRRGWARNAFVVAEVALSVMLVVAAALLGRSLVALATVDMGFAPDRVLLLRTGVPVRFALGPSEFARAVTFYREVLEDMRAQPGVAAAGGVYNVPTAVRSSGGYWIDGGPTQEEMGVRSPTAVLNVVTPGYFDTMRIPIRRGRDFSDGDGDDAPLVAIVNETLARAAFPDQNPIGRKIRTGLDRPEYMTIVAVVGDVRTYGPERPADAEVFMPYEQHTAPASFMSLVVRGESGDPSALIGTMQRLIRQRNADVAVQAETMEDTLTVATATPRFRTFLLVVLAAVALLLALAGVYSVMSYTVGQRLPELGIRAALGASPRDILALVMRHGGTLTGIGVAIGIALSLAVSQLLSGMLFGVTARDPSTVAAVAALVAFTALAACYIPSRRAVRVAPVVVLRAE